MATIDSYTAHNEISNDWQEGNSVEITSLEDQSTLDQIREQAQKPWQHRVKIIESNENFTVSIIDGTIRVKELSKKARESKISFWNRENNFYIRLDFFCLSLIGLSYSCLFRYCSSSFAPILFFSSVCLNIIAICLFETNRSKAIQQKSAWQANLSEDIAKLRQYVFVGGVHPFLMSLIHSEKPSHKKICKEYFMNNRVVKKIHIAEVARKYPGFSSSFYYACLGKNGYKRLIEGDSLFKPSEDPLSFAFSKRSGFVIP